MSSNSKRVALIVGAGSAVGAEIARGLAGNFRVALNDLLPTRIEPLATELSANGDAAAFPADISRKLSLQTMLQEVLERFGRIDVLIFVSNIQPPDSIMDMDEWDWHRTLDLNLTAAFLCMQSVGRVMREIGGGIIVNVLAAQPTTSIAYEAAAAAITALSRDGKAEFGAHKIHVQIARSAEDAIKSVNQLIR